MAMTQDTKIEAVGHTEALNSRVNTIIAANSIGGSEAEDPYATLDGERRMPQASEKLRAKMRDMFEALYGHYGLDELSPISYLKDQGYALTTECTWRKEGVDELWEMKPDELACMSYLVEEWDYGGLHEGPMPEVDEEPEIIPDDEASSTTKLKKTGREFIEAVETVFDWMNGNDLSADHFEQKPEDYERVSNALVAFRAALSEPTP